MTTYIDKQLPLVLVHRQTYLWINMWFVKIQMKKKSMNWREIYYADVSKFHKIISSSIQYKRKWTPATIPGSI